MDCDICHRGHDAKRLQFVCAVDARNQIYESRMKYLRVLIDNEDLQNQVGDLKKDATPPSKEFHVSLQAQQRRAEDRTTQILAAADKLRNEIQAAKEEIQARKAALSRRKSDLASVSEGLTERRIKQQGEVEKSIGMVKYRWNQNAEDMARTRSFLCKEAAKLYGLRRTRRGSSGRYDYHLGRVPVVDLSAMNSLSPEEISTSLAHVSHILMIASHYLSVRLPAAMTLPHRDYPRPTIFNLSGSYLNGDPLITNPSELLAPPIEARSLDSQQISRPRPLFTDRPLLQLSKEDPSAYSFFLEGVTLLAYNIAWLCSTQGVPIGDKSSFDDLCNMGRNLYNLLIVQQTESGTIFPGDSVNKNSTTNIDDSNVQNNWMGRFSHATTYYHLGSANGNEFVRNFKLPNPMKLADKLRKKLVSDTPVPDWEVLDDDAWKIEEGPEDALLIETQKLPSKDKSNGDKNSPRRGSSGWMKVKNR